MTAHACSVLLSPIMQVHVDVTLMELEGQRAAWLSAQPCVPMEERLGKTKATTEARVARRLAEFTPKHGPEIAAKMVAGKPWQGATLAMMIDAFGPPSATEEKVLKTKSKRSLSYKEVNGAGVSCRKCDGTGFIPEYAHINNGVCTLCRGTGTGRGFALIIQLENDVVVGWEDKR